MQILNQPCRRLIASGMLPGRGGQPTQITLHMSLAQLRGSSGSSPAEAAWAAARASQPGWVTGPEAEAAGCDATVVPIVTGHIDWTALDRFTDVYLATRPGSSLPSDGQASATRPRLRQALLALAIDALSGPEGLAARLREGLDGRPLTAPSLPLDVGTATETIPAHLRRAVTTRHPHCAFPGCAQPASVCEVHHFVSVAATVAGEFFLVRTLAA